MAWATRHSLAVDALIDRSANSEGPMTGTMREGQRHSAPTSSRFIDVKPGAAPGGIIHAGSTKGGGAPHTLPLANSGRFAEGFHSRFQFSLVAPLYVPALPQPWFPDDPKLIVFACRTRTGTHDCYDPRGCAARNRTMIPTSDSSSTTADDVPDLEDPGKKTLPLWRRAWPEKNDPERSHIFGVPARWLLVVGFFTSAITIILCAVGTAVPRSAKRMQTGIYSADAPFVEIFSSNFPDPALFRVNETWYVYGTNSAAGIIESKVHGQVKYFGVANVQLATSTNLLEWTLTSDPQGPLQGLGEWAAKDMMPAEADNTVEVRRANVWAPEILQRPDGRFVLYYSATAASAADSAVHCVGAAISDDPTGPFEPEESPIACPIEEGGAIDPGAITDSDGSIYLAYKIDGNLRGLGGECGNMMFPQRATPIVLQKLEEDGITLSGAPVTILDRTFNDGPLVEAPVVARSEEGVYFLFYSSGCTWNPSYNVKYATSTSITGPYTRASEPLLQTGSWGLLAPGSPTVWQDDSKWYMAFHARLFTDVGGIRGLYMTGLKLNGTTATLETQLEL
ncbi:glycoside hydrolase family 43 protein [Lentithecium fluviatile CBS 122367]|uniref:Glycoside hydrolase family 43 protein n=1 Tax=Lentithecium fluviatile CBS 122367 TaxID=1168545 RepID=A0A6G1JC89_9PLEO|nr:glycoside hydrolase family 43 protein [Lentithecium fluviatile CBS 122367]